MEKNNNKLVVFLIIIIFLLAGGGFLLYKTIFNSSNSNANLGESNNVNNQLAGENNNNVTNSGNSLVTYIDNIPQINIAEATDFNKKATDFYNSDIVDGNVTFSSVLQDNILFCSIEYSYRAGMGGDFQTASFIYDLVNKKTMKIKDILSKFEINVSKLDITNSDKGYITGSDADEYYYIMPTADGFLMAYPTGMGFSKIQLY